MADNISFCAYCFTRSIPYKVLLKRIYSVLRKINITIGIIRFSGRENLMKISSHNKYSITLVITRVIKDPKKIILKV